MTLKYNIALTACACGLLEMAVMHLFFRVDDDSFKLNVFPIIMIIVFENDHRWW